MALPAAIFERLEFGMELPHFVEMFPEAFTLANPEPRFACRGRAFALTEAVLGDDGLMWCKATEEPPVPEWSLRG